MSATLVQEKGVIQNPIYYVSKVLIDAQTRYTRVEKLVFALFFTMRKLKRYFLSFRVIMLTEYPLRIIVENPEANDRITKWVKKIRPLGVTFELRTTIKGQIMATSLPSSHQDLHHRVTSRKRS